MHLNDDPQSLYDILELTPDATPQEIRSAYLRLKSAYGKDNIAHYTVFSREETESMLQNIEAAFLILSNPEKRKAYDHGQGLAQPLNESASISPASTDSYSSFPSFPAAASAPVANESNDIDTAINNETNWSGAAIKRVREAKRITLEDLSDYTRISRSYLLALEEEDFSRLPANVYIRGFLQQVSKRLKLPTEQVSNQYLSRLKNARPEK